mmetsp:Transcript_23162/g.32058  ORF Transcript_23162/g.32058 Transcript_23162/m.32058 type:complete len:472 (+) Transcript_23162:263-1678(+)
MTPNLKEQLSKSKSPYNANVSRFLMQATQAQESGSELSAYSRSVSNVSLSSNAGAHGLGSTFRSAKELSTEPDSPMTKVLIQSKDQKGSGFNDIQDTYEKMKYTSYLGDMDMRQKFDDHRLGENFHFNVLVLAPLEESYPLMNCCMYLIYKLDLVKRMNLQEAKLGLFFKEVESGYHCSNPYHNNVHAADVTQRLVTILCSSGAYPRHLRDVDMLAAIIAAAIHDYEHPGMNNAFMVNTGHSIAQQHNDQHVLENHSLCVCLDLMAHHNFAEHMTSSDKMLIRKTIIPMVLHTDMAEHFGVISHFCQKITKPEFQRMSSGSTSSAFNMLHGLRTKSSFVPLRPDQRVLLLQMAIKVSDLGHTTLRQAEHITWVEALQAEFFLQGDVERERGMPLSPLSDREKIRNGPAAGENQIGFFEVLCKPMLAAWIEVFPECSSLLEQLDLNLRYWKEDSESSFPEIVRLDSIEVEAY